MNTFEPSRKAPLSAFIEVPDLLPYGRRSGPLKIGPNRPVGKQGLIHAVCDCGNSGWYPKAQLQTMVDTHSGCGEPSCTALSLADKVWASPDSLRLQLCLLLAMCPDQVQSAWGGTLDDLYVVSREEAETALKDYMAGLPGMGLWVVRIDDELPYMEGNVKRGTKPEKAFRRFSNTKITVDGTEFTLKELCDIGNRTAAEILSMICDRGTTDDLLAALMEE
jgi:hypothetical protein